jgi:hypothetical protein
MHEAGERPRWLRLREVPMTDALRTEAPMSTGKAAEIYGFGKGEAARKNFIRYVEDRETKSGQAIFIRRGKDRRITESVVRRRLPELSKKKLDALEERIRSGLAKIDENLAGQIDERIANHPTILELQEQHLQVTEILARVVEGVERVTRNGHERTRTESG